MTHPTSETRNAQQLQTLIDDVAARGGGTVEVPSGTYVLKDSIHLRDGVHLVGQGDSLFTRQPGTSSPIADFLGFGFREFSVREPDKFEVGMGVTVADENGFGFYTTVATIVGRTGERFLVDRAFAHDYLPQSGGRVVHLFPLVSGNHIKDASVSGIILDGNPAETEVLNGCRGAGVFLIGCQRVRLAGVEVRHYNGDAISFQQCTDIIVRRCHLHHNTGSGLHPGSGSVRYLFHDNHIHDNGGCGIFYCLRTTHSSCSQNIIERNGNVGISIGERDSNHQIVGNTLRDNAFEGILCREPFCNGGDRIQITNNVIGPNWKQNAPENAAEIRVEGGVHDIHVVGNRIETNLPSALRVEEGSTGVFFVDNMVCGRAQTSEDVAGAVQGVSFASPPSLPTNPPEHLPLDGARHLGWELLPTWTEEFQPYDSFLDGFVPASLYRVTVRRHHINAPSVASA